MKRGFTLIELLVALSILAVLTVMTIGVININRGSERIRGAARLLQAKLEGARSRGVSDENTHRPAGVRLLVDENNPTLCTGLVYVRVPEPETTGSVVLRKVSDFQQVIGVDTNWSTLSERGLMGPGSHVTVAYSGGSGVPLEKLTILPEPSLFPLSGPGPHVLHTLEEHPETPDSGGVSSEMNYSLSLHPDLIPNDVPLKLPAGTCINLETSVLPDGWRIGPQRYSSRMDILFSRRGPCVGDAASKGVIHLHLMEVGDALAGALPGSPTVPQDLDVDGEPDPRQGGELGITIFTASGRTIVHPLADENDPWRFGLEGEVAR